jgi:hypothetical protein
VPLQKKLSENRHGRRVDHPPDIGPSRDKHRPIKIYRSALESAASCLCCEQVAPTMCGRSEKTHN